MDIKIYAPNTNNVFKLQLSNKLSHFAWKAIMQTFWECDYMEWIYPDCLYHFDKSNLEKVIKRAELSNIKYVISFEEFILIKKGFTSANKQKPQKVVITETKDGSCDVKFDYNKTVVEILKKIDGQYRTFDKGTKLWKINRLSLEEFLKNLKEADIAYECTENSG